MMCQSSQVAWTGVLLSSLRCCAMFSKPSMPVCSSSHAILCHWPNSSLSSSAVATRLPVLPVSLQIQTYRNTNCAVFLAVTHRELPVTKTKFCVDCCTNIYSHDVLPACHFLLQGIFVDEQGMVAEGPNMNLGIITNDNELVVSFFQAAECMCFVCYWVMWPSMSRPFPLPSLLPIASQMWFNTEHCILSLSTAVL